MNSEQIILKVKDVPGERWMNGGYNWHDIALFLGFLFLDYFTPILCTWEAQV